MHAVMSAKVAGLGALHVACAILTALETYLHRLSSAL